MPAGCIGSVEEDLKPLLFVFAQIGVSHKNVFVLFPLRVVWSGCQS